MLSGRKHGKSILLFYKEFEADKFFPGDRYLKRLVRPLYNVLHHRQKKTGFAVSFEMLCKALRRAGYELRINDYRFARAHPDYPVGIIGFPLILDDWKLPNPALLGPSLYDHPGLAPNLFEDSRYRNFLVLGDWTYDMFETAYKGKCIKWFAGIDTEDWPDRSTYPKTTDVLIYDKVRWGHDAYETSMINPICRILEARGLTYRMVRYKYHDHETYKQALNECRSMIFLCEHETQGLAYQEALASGVPILAWDPGFWVDPLWKRFQKSPPPTSSVPFFSAKCGGTFKDMERFEGALDTFWARLPGYDPRGYIRETLTLERSAEIYSQAYFNLTRSK